MSKQPVPPILWTMNSAAAEFDLDPKTLKKRLKATGAMPADGNHFTTKQIRNAVYTDLELARVDEVRERTRHAKAEADLKERKIKQLDGKTIDTDVVLALWGNFIISLRQRIQQLSVSEDEKTAMCDHLRAIPESEYLANLPGEMLDEEDPK